MDKIANSHCALESIAASEGNELDGDNSLDVIACKMLSYIGLIRSGGTSTSSVVGSFGKRIAFFTRRYATVAKSWSECMTTSVSNLRKAHQ